MGAKQSKRSVDISGKEAEGGGEVAAAGAGGEGRVEQIADVDALKTQLNGDAHIQHEKTDKEKELDSGTPENEKDATTEKEETEGSEKEKEAAPVTNGDAEEKIENGESTPTAEDGKKPKKEKVKKKWSLRSISFSRKDKPKQEKKQKDEEPKTNGEPEKVPEETAETTPESATNEVAEEVKAVAKEETTPETPVTEPLTNGSSTPESVKVDTPATEEVAPAQTPEADKPEPQPEPEPEQLPINGLSLEESKTAPAEVEKTEEIKAESPAANIVETAPAPEIPVKEVCVEQMPLLEPTPPPLPANPPPSSVASFAATTMAPELTDTASLPNTADTTAATLTALPTDLDNNKSELSNVTVTVVQNDISSTLKTSEAEPEPPTLNDVESLKESDNVVIESGEDLSNNVESETAINAEVNMTPEQIDALESKPEPIQVSHEDIKLKSDQMEVTENIPESEPETVTPQQIVESKPSPDQEIVEIKDEPADDSQEILESKPEQTTDSVEIKAEPETVDIEQEIIDIKPEEIVTNEVMDSTPEPIDIPPPSPESPLANDSPLPPPPPIQEDDDIEVVDDIKPAPEDIQQEAEQIIEPNHVGDMVNGITLNDSDIAAEGDNKIKTKATGIVNKSECNGVGEESGGGGGEASADHTPQEALTVSDKLADLIPEVPDVPELKTETLPESASDVVVAN